MDIVILIVFCLIIISAIQGVRQKFHNNFQPSIPYKARVLAKQQENILTPSLLGYWANRILDKYCHITFEILSIDDKEKFDALSHNNTSEWLETILVGDIRELCVPREVYDMVSKGDIGILFLVGTGYDRFERQEQEHT